MILGAVKARANWRVLLIMAGVAGAAAFVVFSFVFTQTLRVQGIAEDVCVLDNQRWVPGYFVETIPRGAKDIQYYVEFCHGFGQAVFPCTEAVFVDWCKGSDWPIEKAEARFPCTFWVHGPSGTSPKKIADGWHYSGPKQKKSPFWVEVAYDRSEKRVYFHIWHKPNR